ncbi:MAG: heme exporter protein CcmD [Hyphomicrobiaceae bacterium]
MKSLELGSHAPFIVAAYVAAALVLAGLTWWLIHDNRRQRRRLAGLEARGLHRRSGRTKP